MNPWWLLLIIPSSIYIGMGIMALLLFSKNEDVVLHQTECYNNKCPKHDGGEEPIAVCDLKCPK